MSVPSEVEQSQSNTNLYGIRSRIESNRANIKQSSDRFVDILKNVQSLSDDHEQTKSSVTDLASRVNTLENQTAPDVSNQLSEFSVSQLEPLLNDLQDQIEALSIDVQTLKANKFQQPRQAMDTESRPPAGNQNGKIQLRGRSLSQSRY
jgi:chromosome segregation ATPase